MRDWKSGHSGRLGLGTLIGCFWSVIMVAGGISADAATIENSKSIKIEKLLTLIRISELESEYETLTQKYVSEYEQQIRKSIAASYPNMSGDTKKEIERLLDAFLTDIRQSMGKMETLHDHLKQAYSRNFGEDELDRLIAHYSSPVG